MKRTKIFCLLLICLILTTTPTAIAFAQTGTNNNNIQILSEYIEITDPEVLLERARNNITDSRTLAFDPIVPNTNES